MLLSLRIANFVLMDDCRIEFHRGLNVLTGETGAGKSIIVGALAFLLGERSSTERIRDPERDALVEAEFELEEATPVSKHIYQQLEDTGIPIEDNLLLLSRRITANGRSRIFINNTPCLLKVLRLISDSLVDLHGQHEHQSLLHKSRYRPLLDESGRYQKQLQIYRERYREFIEVSRRMHELIQDDRERLRMIEIHKHQLDEIESAELQPGEDEEIDARLKIIQNIERLNSGCADLIRSLSEGDHDRPAILDELNRLDGVLSDILHYDSTLASISETWQNALISIQEVVRELQSYSEQLDFDSEDLENLQQRRFLIKNLKNKYGATIEEILSYRDKIEAELNKMNNIDEQRAQLQKREQALQDQLKSLASELHEQRVKTASKIAQHVTRELGMLGMKQANFTIDVNFRLPDSFHDLNQTKFSHFGPDGADDVEFLVSTIPDKPPRPLREVASGGEISRIMLALKCTLGKVDPVDMMVFDEIDVGVGGETAEVVADRLADLACQKQVLCITHLAQIASKADRNLRVEKAESKGKLTSTVSTLKGKEREREIARMLGDEESTASQRYARELLQRAAK